MMKIYKENVYQLNCPDGCQVPGNGQLHQNQIELLANLQRNSETYHV